VTVGRKFRIGVLGSVKGSNFAAIAAAIAAGQIPADVSSKESAAVKSNDRRKG